MDRERELKYFSMCYERISAVNKEKKIPLMGLEPTTFELEVQRAIRCATAAYLVTALYNRKILKTHIA